MGVSKNLKMKNLILILLTTISVNIYGQKDTITTTVNWPLGIVNSGNYLFIVENTDNEITKIDLTIQNPTPVVITNGLFNPHYLTIVGNYLYFTEYSGNKISKIDITQTNPVPATVISGLNGPLGGMKINGNELYFFEYSSSEISMIDISSPTPIITNIDVGVVGGDIEFIGNDMYVSDFQNDLILKYTNLLLSIKEEINPSFEIFPNPSSNFISIKGVVERMTGSIYNSLGVKIREFIIHDNITLDISCLNTGTYFVVFPNGWSNKFKKE